jgi:phosphatidylglycerophosphatase A
VTAPAPRKTAFAHVLATWFGCGLVPYAPGTAGTLGAVPLYLALRPLGQGAVAAAAIVLTAVGIWVAGIVAKEEGLKDPHKVVIDEVAGVLVTLSVAPANWRALCAGVVLFRIFDQTKPWPARKAERELPGGWGIVLDDVAAGVWGAVVLYGLVLARVV